jgi:SET domain-containing protein 6
MMAEALRTDSRWAPYLATLPRKLDTLVFWSSSELAQLQASAVVTKIGKSAADDLFYQKVAPIGLEGATLEFFHQMASVIMAYAFDIPEDDLEDESEDQSGEELIPDEDAQRTILTMIPLADMLNADADQCNARLVCDNEDLEMRSIKPIVKGQEILNDYGPLPRSDLLRRYAYITDRYAAYDVVELSTNFIVSTIQAGLRFGIESNLLEPLESADLELRLELARREDIFQDSYDISHADSEESCLPDELVALVYLLLVDEQNLTSIQRSESTFPSRSKMATELLGAVTGRLLQLREQQYATSLEEDSAILEAGNTSYRETMAIKVRQGEKIVLRGAIVEAASFRGSNKRMRGSFFKQEVQVEPRNPAKRIRLR